MRIGIDARLVYYSKAGIGQYIIHLTRGLAKIKTPQDQFILLQSRKDKAQIINNSNFERKSLWTPSHHRLEQLAIRFETAPLRLDLLHSPDFIPPLNRRYKSVITVHDLAFLLYPQFMTKESARYYGQIDQAVRSTNHIIAVSQATKQDLINLLGVPKDKITVIYEGRNPIYEPINKAKAHAFVKAKFGLEPNFIFFVSTLEPRKNIPTLLEGYKWLKIHHKRPEKLVLTGSKGWLIEEIEETIEKLGLKNDVLLTGRVNDSALHHLYNAASIFAYPSFYEGFGLPPLEAMNCGIPVIASKIKVMPEVVGDAALLVDPHDAEDLGIAMHRLLTDETLRTEMIAKGFKRAANFSWEQTARETLAVYHQVVEGG
jgi:glycosyltransferase involved in cell wall biosynthesis